jgi:FixJ family two-component response regulator
VNARQPLVLLVEDDESVREALGRLLRISELEVAAFANVSEFLAYNRPGRPACLLLDVYLPDGNGLELAARLAATDPGLPVVLMTAQLNEGLSRRAAIAGAFGFMVKPLDSDQLLDEIHRALASVAGGRP